jgi:hypothetical protein
MQIFSDSDDLPMKAETKAEKSLLRSLLKEDVAVEISWFLIVFGGLFIWFGGS